MTGYSVDFMVLMQLISLGMVAFGGAWIAGAFGTLHLSAQSYTVAVATPVALAWILADLPLQPAEFLWSMVLVTALVCIATVDTKLKAVPDAVSIPVIGVGLLQAASSSGHYVFHALAALGMILVAIGLETLRPHRLNRIGPGDVLMIAAALAWFGPTSAPDLALVAGVVLMVQVLLRQIPLPAPDACIPVTTARDSRLALGAALMTAQMVLWFGGPLL